MFPPTFLVFEVESVIDFFHPGREGDHNPPQDGEPDGMAVLAYDVPAIHPNSVTP